jgi:hypothetical protein
MGVGSAEKFLPILSGSSEKIELPSLNLISAVTLYALYVLDML